MLPTVRSGRTSPNRSYLRSVCGCMPSMRETVLMKRISLMVLQIDYIH